MTEPVTSADAQRALGAVEEGRRQVIQEIGMPHWYWWSVAIGWVGLGVVTDLGWPWATVTATFIFGTVHAAMYQFVSAGRRRTSRVSVGAATVGRYASLLVLGGLLGLAAVTIAGSLLVGADGASHPVTIASVPVAVAIVLGGPTLMAAIRRAAARPHHAA